MGWSDRMQPETLFVSAVHVLTLSSFQTLWSPGHDLQPGNIPNNPFLAGLENALPGSQDSPLPQTNQDRQDPLWEPVKHAGARMSGVFTPFPPYL